MHGDPAILNGELTRPLRTEAEARAAVRERNRSILGKRKAGETFEQLEHRLFDEARARFDLAISSARAAMEDANLDTQILDDHIADTIGDTWEATQ